MPGLVIAIAFSTPNLGIVVPLILVCTLIVIVLPIVARTGKLTIPAAGCTAAAGVVLGMLVGYLCGITAVRGTTLGSALAVVFFLIVAAVVGCVLSIFFYREPRGLVES